VFNRRRWLLRVAGPRWQEAAWKGITAEVNSHFLDRYRQLLG
jgi:hypothetical protein